MDRYKFGEFIYQKRKKLGLTQEELGRRLGVTNKAVSKWEVGETTPDITILEPLANILQVTVDELLTQKEVKVEEQKKIKLNKLLLSFTIILSSLVLLVSGILITTNVITVISFNNALKDKDAYYHELLNKEESVNLSLDNVDNYVKVFPMTNFINNGQQISIESLIDLNDGYNIKENSQVDLIIDFEINYYYYTLDGKMNIITYYRNANNISLNTNISNQTINLDLSPKAEIEDYSYLRNVIVTYEIVSVDGVIYKNK